ncbi:hypothetical protein SETIT_5G402300v2 [Setaria italica]|uniref:Uncharacterized protein n=1 Tax=Setaria italica TaxID=4555 RepID=A0A368REA6_SETIT|nr:hypothetical protein SETIT_5G402300v2 [Setaria italica]
MQFLDLVGAAWRRGEECGIHRAALAPSIGCRCRCMWWPESPRGRCSDAGSWSRHSTCHAATRKLEQHCTSSCWSRARLARASRWLEPCLPRVCVERRGLEMRLARYDSVQMHVTVVVR